MKSPAASQTILARALWMLAPSVLPAILLAQSLPPPLRACAAQTDAARRHACYDREVERILDAERHAAARTGATATRVEPRPAAAAQPTGTRRKEPSSDRISARIASIDDDPDALILHLDNGEVWQQTDRSSGGLSLRPGDAVSIEKRFGSYYLSSRHVSAMRVRKRTD